jgi:hypothetical protein
MHKLNIDCDDGSRNKLKVLQTEDGDIHIWVNTYYPETDRYRASGSIRICTMQGGTRSPGLNIEFVKLLRKAIEIAKEHPYGGTKIE